MSRIQSDKVSVNNPAGDTFRFLSDFNNYETLMPERISSWESTEEECSFTIKGMASIGMRIAELVENREIRIKSTNKSPFRFDLNCYIDSEGETCSSYFVFESDLNPMLQMMVEKPLASLFNHIVQRLKSHFD